MDRASAVRRWSRRLLIAAALATTAALLLPVDPAFAAPPEAAAAPRPDAPAEAADRDAAEQAPDQAAEQQRAERQRLQEPAEHQARAQAAAEARAARLAAARQRARTAWLGHGRPHQLIIVRTGSVDLVTDGRLTRQAPRPRRRADPVARWTGSCRTTGCAITGGTRRPRGGDRARPADVSADPRRRRARRCGWPAGRRAADAASIYTGRGRLVPARGHRRPRSTRATGGRCRSARAGRSSWCPAAAASRPPTPPSATSGTRADRPGRRAGLSLGADQHRHAGAHHVAAQQHRAQARPHRPGPAGGGDRLRLGRRRPGAARRPGHHADRRHGPSATAATGCWSPGPATDRPITGISAPGNKLFGVALLGQTRADGSTASTTAGNTVGGLRVSRSTDVDLSDFTAHRRRRSASTPTSAAPRSRCDRVRIAGARRGAADREDHPRPDADRHARSSGASIAGVAVGGHDVDAAPTSAVNDSATGVRVERGAGERHRRRAGR